MHIVPERDTAPSIFISRAFTTEQIFIQAKALQDLFKQIIDLQLIQAYFLKNGCNRTGATKGGRYPPSTRVPPEGGTHGGGLF